jgi:hypothetical protein
MTIRLHFVVEGQTEETFVRNVLTLHLSTMLIMSDARSVMTSKHKHTIFRGGLLDYERAKKDLELWMKQDDNSDSYFTTMFDLYALPSNFPGYLEAQKIANITSRTKFLEEKLFADFGHSHFIPYLQQHEFESLIFADPQKLDWEFPNNQSAINKLLKVANSVDSPELIDDGPDSAPSKRIINEIPEYEGRKASSGPIITEKIGLEVLRKKCQHFNDWMNRLEGLNKG